MLPPTIHPSPSLTNVHEARDLPTCPCPYPSVEQAMSAGPIQPDLKSFKYTTIVLEKGICSIAISIK